HLKGRSRPSAASDNGATGARARKPPVVAQSLPAGGDTMKCAETGKAVRGIFLTYWKSHGGLAQQGYPISGELQEVSATDGNPYTVQYFERAVFEYHPENQSPYDVLPSLLGARRYKVKSLIAPHGHNPTD